MCGRQGGRASAVFGHLPRRENPAKLRRRKGKFIYLPFALYRYVQFLPETRKQLRRPNFMIMITVFR